MQGSSLQFDRFAFPDALSPQQPGLSRLIADRQTENSPEDAVELVREMAADPSPWVIGLGIDYRETNHAPDSKTPLSPSRTRGVLLEDFPSVDGSDANCCGSPPQILRERPQCVRSAVSERSRPAGDSSTWPATKGMKRWLVLPRQAPCFST